jgi:aromatic ring hydroxylase
MELTIKELSDKFGVPRTTIYRAINSGKMSRLGSGKVELSEFLRAFQSVRSVQDMTQGGQEMDISTHPLFKAQAEKIRYLEEALKETKDRDLWQRNQIEKLTDSLKLLEYKKADSEKINRNKGWLRRWFS